jgi:N-acetylglucosaminyl-diphospho-decaprenol L-rhamnosyltransferase
MTGNSLTVSSVSSSGPPDILISVINYRTADLTLACAANALEEIARAAEQGIRGHLVVIDNASGDGSAETIEAWIARDASDAPVTFLRSPTNSGFSGGHNLGMAHQEAEFYLLLNSDGLLRPGFIASILAAAHARPEMGFFAPRIEHEDGTPQVSAFRFASPASEFMRAVNSGPVTRALRRREVAIGIDPDEADIEWASFACILMRASMVSQIGPMDEGYFLYFEDAEYCLRGRRAGWRVAWVPEARMVHFRGGSGPVKALEKQRKRMPGYFYASRTRFLYQAHGRGGLMLANLLWYLGRALTQLRRLAGKPVSASVQDEARDIWINILNPLGPRLAPHEIARRDPS